MPGLRNAPNPFEEAFLRRAVEEARRESLSSAFDNGLMGLGFHTNTPQELYRYEQEKQDALDRLMRAKAMQASQRQMAQPFYSPVGHWLLQMMGYK